MTLVTHPTVPARRARRFAPLASLAAATVSRVVRGLAKWRHRRDAAMLAGADAHILADLGLSRADVHDALSSPPWEDPTVVLRARALERRLGRHQVSHGFPTRPSAPPQHDALRATPAERPRARHDVSRPNTRRLPARP